MKQARIVGLDVGDVRIGVAVSDELGLLAHPAAIIERASGDPVGKVLEEVTKASASAVVVGLPKNMDGSVGPQAKKVQRFANQLSERAPQLNVEFWDERLSTLQARSMLVQAGAKKSRRARPVDSMSAGIILQSYLDCVRNKS